MQSKRTGIGPKRMPMSVETVESPPGPSDTSGRTGHHRDFVEKVAVNATYADDSGFPRTLQGVVVRAQVPCAHITDIHALGLRGQHLGVHAVLTATDIPNNVITDAASGVEPSPLTNLCSRASDRVRYDGEPVALVAAETEWAAEEAAQLITIDYEEEPATFDPEEALSEEAPAVHPGGNTVSDVVDFGRGRGRRHGRHRRGGRGDLPYAACRPRLPRARGRHRMDRQRWRADLACVDSGNREHARQLAEILSDLPHSRVRVIAAYMGGGFGGKEDMTVEPFLAALVWKTRRPVRMGGPRA